MDGKRKATRSSQQYKCLFTFGSDWFQMTHADATNSQSLFEENNFVCVRSIKHLWWNDIK